MGRFYCKKKYFKKELSPYRKQNNCCSRLYKKERERFFSGLNLSFVTDNKLFWKRVKPFFSDKGNYGANFKLVDEEVLQNHSEIAGKFNQCFKSAVATLGITENTL